MSPAAFEPRQAESATREGAKKYKKRRKAMKKEECEYCYYQGIKKCFLYNKKFEEIENCKKYLLDPYIKIPEGQIEDNETIPD